MFIYLLRLVESVQIFIRPDILQSLCSGHCKHPALHSCWLWQGGQRKGVSIMLNNQHHHPLAHQWLKPQGKCEVDLFQRCFSVKWYFKQTWHLNIHIDRHSILGRSNLPLHKNTVRGILVGMLAATKLDSLYKTEVRCSWCVWSRPAPLLHLSFSVLFTCRLCRSDLKLPPSHLRLLIRGERLIGEEASSNVLGSGCMSCQSSL